MNRSCLKYPVPQLSNKVLSAPWKVGGIDGDEVIGSRTLLPLPPCQQECLREKKPTPAQLHTPAVRPRPPADPRLLDPMTRDLDIHLFFVVEVEVVERVEALIHPPLVSGHPALDCDPLGSRVQHELLQIVELDLRRRWSLLMRGRVEGGGRGKQKWVKQHSVAFAWVQTRPQRCGLTYFFLLPFAFFLLRFVFFLWCRVLALLCLSCFVQQKSDTFQWPNHSINWPRKPAFLLGLLFFVLLPWCLEHRCGAGSRFLLWFRRLRLFFAVITVWFGGYGGGGGIDKRQRPFTPVHARNNVRILLELNPECEAGRNAKFGRIRKPFFLLFVSFSPFIWNIDDTSFFFSFSFVLPFFSFPSESLSSEKQQ